MNIENVEEKDLLKRIWINHTHSSHQIQLLQEQVLATSAALAVMVMFIGLATTAS